MELLALSNKTDARASDVVRLLEQDEMLAASVMRLVSSPIYSGRNKITTLKDAVVRLGSTCPGTSPSGSTLFALTHFEGAESPPREQLWTDVDALHEQLVPQILWL